MRLQLVKPAMHEESKIYVTGHRGLVGSAIRRRLEAANCRQLITREHAELDLTRQAAVDRFFEQNRPEYVFLAAAKVGGIQANDRYPAEFIRDNLLLQTNVMHAAWRYGVRKLLFLGSSCIYPKHACQPIGEDQLLAGPLESTNRAYAIAKIAAIVTAQSYRRQYGFNAISLMPTNLYGPGDNFDLEVSHVLPALIRKFHEAKLAATPRVVVWGTGNPRREFLHVDDLADAALFLMRRYDSGEILNVGVGKDISIRELADLIKRIVGYEGEIVFDTSKPDGTPRKLLDVSRLHALGWRANTPLADGVEQTYRWYVSQREASRWRGYSRSGFDRAVIR